MPGETATQYLSFNGYRSPTRMRQTGPSHSFEFEMGVSPEAFAPVFQFRKRHGEINWRKVAMIDVDKVARELDIDLLQEHIQTVAFCNIDAVSDLDPMFSKLFRLSQYMIEYMLHSQSSLQGIISELEGKLEVAAVQHNSALDKIKELESDVQKLKAENKKRRKMIEQQQMLIESGASSYYKCPHCEKAFMNASFLQGHMQRKHPGSVNYIGDVIAHSQREQSKLAGKLEILDSDLQRERENFTEKLRKAEEEKAAWGARTRRDMQRWKKEEEGKWRKELETMKSTFLQEIQQLKAQEAEYKNRIASLQLTMDERHSNLGELVDDIEGEKQKLTVYEQRIKSLEHTNHEKEQKLRQLSAEMEMLKEHNKNALAKHGKQMAENYDSQLRRLRDQVDQQSRRPLAMEPASVQPPEESESFEEEDGDEEPDAGVRERRKKEIANQMRPLLQRMVDEKLQQCGVDPRAEGISTQTLTNKLMVRKTERQRKARKEPGFYAERDRLKREVDKEAAKRRGSPPRKRRGRTPSHLPKQRQFSPSPIASRSLEQPRGPASHPVEFGGRVDRPSPTRRKPDQTQPVIRKEDKTMTREELNTRFEEEDSPWDSELSELQEVPGPSTQERPTRPSPPTDRQQVTPKTPVTARVPPSTSRQEDSWDSDDLDDLLSPETDIRDTRPKTGGTKVQKLGANIESQLQARSVTKPPAGAIPLFGGLPQQGGSSTTQVKRIESDDEDFSLVSSLHESPKPAPRAHAAPKVRQSTTTVSSTGTLGTSVWGSGQAKPPAGGNDGQEESDWDDISDL